MTAANPEQITNARKLVYVLVVEQKLRAGESMNSAALAAELQRHGMDAATQAQAQATAIAQGWLQQGANGALQVTETGFRSDFAID